MALKFRTVEKMILMGNEAGKVKTIAIAKTNGYCDTEKLCELISARSSISSADVKAVFDSLNWVMYMELRSGNIVQLGEFGSFRLSIRSRSTDTEDELRAPSHIKKAHILFTPGASLRQTKNNVKFEHENSYEKTAEGTAEGDDSEQS
jgi:predicted histone-like DNA-binding protein